MAGAPEMSRPCCALPSPFVLTRSGARCRHAMPLSTGQAKEVRKDDFGKISGLRNRVCRVKDVQGGGQSITAKNLSRCAGVRWLCSRIRLRSQQLQDQAENG